MPFQLEPLKFSERGAHHAIEVEIERVDALRDALDLARTYAETSPLIDWLEAFNPGSGVRNDTLFETDDGYSSALYLKEAILEGLKVDGSDDFGVGIYAAIQSTELVAGSFIFDEDAAESPQWLEAAPDLDFRVASAAELLEGLSFEPSIDEDALGDILEAYDRGEIEVFGVSGLDALDGWTVELVKRLESFQRRLTEIEPGSVATWYDDKSISG